MKLKDFFETLESFYCKGVKSELQNNTRIYCKFYCQAKTFSYDLFATSEEEYGVNFLREPNYRSKLFSFWNHKDTRQEIIDDILNNMKNLKL